MYLICGDRQIAISLAKDQSVGFLFKNNFESWCILGWGGGMNIKMLLSVPQVSSAKFLKTFHEAVNQGGNASDVFPWQLPCARETKIPGNDFVEGLKLQHIALENQIRLLSWI